jgi:endonuclease YncB( thermonuclease family)
MPDLKSYYDRYLLAALGLVAALLCALLALGSISLQESAVLPPAVSKGEPFAPDAAFEALKADRTAMAGKPAWSKREDGASPFVSRVYLLRDDRLVDILESGEELFPGMANTWILEHDLDYLDAQLPERDPDTDGFTNFEEHGAKTNPRDSASRPEEWTKLRLSDVKIEQLQSIFTGRDVKGRALINSVAATSDALQGKPIGPTKTYSPGDTIIVVKYRPGFAVTYDEEKTPFRLKDFRVEERPNPRIMVGGKPQIDKIDIAILESISGDGTQIELEAGKPRTSPYSLASLVDTRPGGQTIDVRTGDTFAVGGENRYKLVDATEESATIENLASKDQHTVPRQVTADSGATPSEQDQPQ